MFFIQGGVFFIQGGVFFSTRPGDVFSIQGGSSMALTYCRYIQFVNEIRKYVG